MPGQLNMTFFCRSLKNRVGWSTPTGFQEFLRSGSKVRVSFTSDFPPEALHGKSHDRASQTGCRWKDLSCPISVGPAFSCMAHV